MNVKEEEKCKIKSKLRETTSEWMMVVSRKALLAIFNEYSKNTDIIF